MDPVYKLALISSAVECCGQKRIRVPVNEKRTPWWNQDIKCAIQAKKKAFKALLQNRSSPELQLRYSEACKAATLAVKRSKERSWEEFGRRLDDNYTSANKVFWQTIRRLRGKRGNATTSIKDSAGNILNDENDILSRWREYFEDLLNPVKANTKEAQGGVQMGNERFYSCRSENCNKRVKVTSLAMITFGPRC